MPSPVAKILRLASPARWARFLRRNLLKLGDRLGWVATAETQYLGRPFSYPADSIIGRQIAAGGEWDSLLRPIASTLLIDESPVICEVGSNIGASLLQMLAAKPAARALAFEPSQRFLPILRRNLSGAGSIEIHTALLGREDGATAILYNNASTASAARKSYHGHEPRRAQKVELARLDRFCLELDRLDLLKVDTDGFDFEVLRGGEQSIRRHQPILFFEFTPGFLENPGADLAWLQSLGYRRLTCFGARGELVGTTDDPAQAIRWAEQDPSEYVDILACPVGCATDELRDALVSEVESRDAARAAAADRATPDGRTPPAPRPDDPAETPQLEPLA
jgi:FkbM family methyltransferase